MANRTIREIAEKHQGELPHVGSMRKLRTMGGGCRKQCPGCSERRRIENALRELLEACCAEICQDCADGMPIQKEPPKGWEDRPWWHVFGKQLVGCRAARIRKLGGE